MDMTWRDVTIKHFGHKLRNKIGELRLNVSAVDVGLKPGYLFDFGVKNVCTISSFLKDLSSLNLTENQLVAVKAEMDYLIINALCLCDMYESKGDHYRFVDVSPHLKAPREITEMEPCDWREDLFKIIDRMKGCENENVRVFEIPSGKSLNMTSLFGILLGFPVVYWYEAESVDTGNCLCMEPLYHYEVVGKTDKGFQHVIYSFSTPSRLSDLDDHVEIWFEKMKNSKSLSSIFTEICLEKNSVTLPVVAL